MSDLLALSTRIIDEGLVDQPINRITQELSEIAEGLAIVESFSHVVAFRTDAGLVLFDTSGKLTAVSFVTCCSFEYFSISSCEGLSPRKFPRVPLSV